MSAFLPERTIHEVQEANEEAGRFFFSPSTMRFFDSKICERVFAGADGWYFVTSEQFKDSHDKRGPRRFTVRRQVPNGDVHKVHEFQGFASEGAAYELAEQLAYESARKEMRRRLGPCREEGHE
jgi:hypothetical protein